MPLGTAAQQLVQLNFRFLKLAACCPEFSGAIAAQLADTGPEQRLRMADCRLSLFSLALNDSCRWLPLLSRGTIDTPLNAMTSSDKAMCREFSMSVVFLAWHFAQSQPLAAKVLLCMSDDVAAALARIPVAHLPSIADNASDWLAPRWPQHPFFWSGLIRHSGDPSGSGLTALKSLGRQLLAAESLALRMTSQVASQGFVSSNFGGEPPKAQTRPFPKVYPRNEKRRK
jgi:hypothetical protein